MSGDFDTSQLLMADFDFDIRFDHFLRSDHPVLVSKLSSQFVLEVNYMNNDYDIHFTRNLLDTIQTTCHVLRNKKLFWCSTPTYVYVTYSRAIWVADLDDNLETLRNSKMIVNNINCDR